MFSRFPTILVSYNLSVSPLKYGPYNLMSNWSSFL